MQRARELVSVFLVLASCGPATTRATSSLPTDGQPARAAYDATTGNVASVSERLAPALLVTLRPERQSEGTAVVHASVVVPPEVGTALAEWRGISVHFTNLTVTDAHGVVPTKSETRGFDLLRPRAGRLTVAYDVPASATATASTLDPMVLDDRFRGAGERLILLPNDLPDGTIETKLTVDASAINAPLGASTVGVGTERTAKIRPAALQQAAFLAGSLGTAVFDGFEHDEAAWLGYTAFDGRGVAAEIAEIRSALAELFDEGTQPWTTLFLAQSRPMGSFSTRARAGGLLVELGPSEPWAAPLRLAITHELVRTSIGGDLSFVGAAPWLDGVARFEATRALSRLGRLTPDEVRAVIAGEMSTALTSSYRGKSYADVTAKLTSDPNARAVLVARGALYAWRVNALLRAKKPASSLDAALLELLVHARQAHGEPLPMDAWTNALSSALGPDEVGAFHAAIDAGGDPTVPPVPRPLGPCFRASRGEYVAFDLGFDEAATLAAAPRTIAGLEPNGPAAKAGIQTGDVLLSLEENGGERATQVGIVVTRNGKEIAVDYDPLGPASARVTGPTFTRVTSLRDGQCGDVL